MENNSDTLVEAAVAEIESISRHVSNLLERKRVLEEMVMRLRAIGASNPVSGHSAAILAVSVATGVEPTAGLAKRRPTKKQQVREAIRELLVEKGEAPRQMLLAHLIDKGLLGGGVSEPARRLGTLLHLFKDEFESDGKGNYRLRPPGSSEPGAGFSHEKPA